MGKNNRLINQMNELARKHRNENVGRAIRNMMPQFYAAFGIALHRMYGFGATRIVRVFNETREIWDEFEGRGEELAKQCFEETGITITNDPMEEEDG